MAKTQMALLLVLGLRDLGAALGDLPLSHPAVERGGAACSDDWSCSLGGECQSGACVCDHWTTGPVQHYYDIGLFQGPS